MTKDKMNKKRWIRKAKRVFSDRNTNGFKQWGYACDLARDILRTLDLKRGKK